MSWGLWLWLTRGAGEVLGGLLLWGLHGLGGAFLGSMLAATQEHPFPSVQPDPPVNITVTAVDGNPRWLALAWQDPPSWNSHFYRLQFELRYRAERSKTFTTWMVTSLPSG